MGYELVLIWSLEAPGKVGGRPWRLDFLLSPFLSSRKEKEVGGEGKVLFFYMSGRYLGCRGEKFFALTDLFPADCVR